MPFDPSKPFTVDASAAPSFDPSKPFTVDASPPHQAAAPSAPEPHTSAPGLAASISRGLAPYAAGAGAGALAGAPFGGVGAIPGAMAGAGAVGLTQLALGIYNPIAQKFGLPQAGTPQEATDKLLDLAGIKRPSTGTERTAEAAASGAAGAFTGAGAAGEIAAGATNPVVKGVAGRLAEAPASQAVAGASGSAAQQGAAEGGAGPLGQAAAGVAGSLVPGAAGTMAGKALAPKLSTGAKTLLDAGVELTPGQMGEGTFKRAEEAGKSIPVVGTGVREAEGRAFDSWNLATANKALEPIGVVLPKGVAGRDIIGEGQKALSAAYDQVVPHLNLTADPGLVADVRALKPMVEELPTDLREQFMSFLTNRLQPRFAATGQLDGQTLKQLQSELTAKAAGYKSAADPAQREMGQLLDTVNGIMRDAVERQNPAYAGQLRKIDSAYAMFTRVEGAAARRAGSDGRFTPADLLAAVKAGDKSVRKRSFARGDGLLQDWGQTANDVIGNKLPDSGTPERMMFDIGGGGGILGGEAALHPGAVLPTAAGMAAGRALYSRPGTALARGYANPGQARAAVGNFLRQPVSPLPLLGGFSTNPYPPSPAAPYIDQKQ